MIDTIIALDPSGNFLEGKGTTGYTVFDVTNNKVIETDIISANTAECQEEYWMKHVLLLQELTKQYPNSVIRIEDFLLYQHKAKDQIQSHFETPQLIGILKYWCYINNKALFIRSASTVKNRWTDEILERKKYIKKLGSSWVCPGCNNQHPLTLHERDSIRHAVACYYFDIEVGEGK